MTDDIAIDGKLICMTFKFILNRLTMFTDVNSTYMHCVHRHMATYSIVYHLRTGHSCLLGWSSLLRHEPAHSSILVTRCPRPSSATIRLCVERVLSL